MGLVWTTTLKDLRRRMRDPLALALWLGIPLLVGGMVVLAFGDRGADTFKARLLIVDEDRSLASNVFTSALARTPVLDTETVSDDEGRARIDAGKATALLRIPPGFGDSLLAGAVVTLPLVLNPAQSILPQIVEEVVGMIAEAGYYVLRLLRPVLPDLGGAMAQDRGPTNDEIARVGASVNGVMQRGGRYLNPPALKLEVERVGSDRPQGGWGLLFFPGILFMSLIFMSQGMGSDIWQEAEAGTLRRVASAPAPLAAFVAGKVLASGAVMAGVTLCGLVLGVAAFGIAPAAIPAALLWATFSGMVFTAALMVLQLAASSARTANVVTSMVVFPLLMVGGSFFPFETMPAWLARIGRLTPNGWAVTQLKRILAGEADLASVAPAFLGLLAVVAIAVALAPRALRRRFGMA